MTVNLYCLSNIFVPVFHVTFDRSKLHLTFRKKSFYVLERVSLWYGCQEKRVNLTLLLTWDLFQEGNIKRSLQFNRKISKKSCHSSYEKGQGRLYCNTSFRMLNCFFKRTHAYYYIDVIRFTLRRKDETRGS